MVPTKTRVKESRQHGASRAVVMGFSDLAQNGGKIRGINIWGDGVLCIDEWIK